MSEKRWISVLPKGAFSCILRVFDKRQPDCVEMIPRNIYKYYKQHVNPDGEDFTKFYETGDILAQTPLEILYFQIMEGKEFNAPIVDYQMISFLQYLSYPDDQEADERMTKQSDEQIHRLIEYIVGYLQLPSTCGYISWALRVHYGMIAHELYEGLTSAGSSYTTPMTEKRYMEIINIFFGFFEKYQKTKGLTNGLVAFLQEITLRPKSIYSDSYESKSFHDRRALNRDRTTFDDHIDCSRFLLKLLLYKVYIGVSLKTYQKVIDYNIVIEVSDTRLRDPSNFFWLSGDGGLSKRWLTIFRFSKTPYGSLVCDEKFIEDFADISISL